LTVLGRIPQHERIGGLFGEQAGQRLASLRGDSDRLEALLDDLRGKQHRLDEVRIRGILAGQREVRSKTSSVLAGGVAACAGEFGAIEHNSATAGIALL